MIIEVPLPMPRSPICSPSHMMNAVPVVSEIMVISRKPQPGSRTTSPYCVEPLSPSKYSARPVLCTMLITIVP